jgi:hypothetical protein
MFVENIIAVQIKIYIGQQVIVQVEVKQGMPT